MEESMDKITILLRAEKEGGQMSREEEIEKYRRERERESEGGRKGGQRSHGGRARKEQ